MISIGLLCSLLVFVGVDVVRGGGNFFSLSYPAVSASCDVADLLGKCTV